MAKPAPTAAAPTIVTTAPISPSSTSSPTSAGATTSSSTSADADADATSTTTSTDSSKTTLKEKITAVFKQLADPDVLWMAFAATGPFNGYVGDRGDKEGGPGAVYVRGNDWRGLEKKQDEWNQQFLAKDKERRVWEVREDAAERVRKMVETMKRMEGKVRRMEEKARKVEERAVEKVRRIEERDAERLRKREEKKKEALMNAPKVEQNKVRAWLQGKA